MLFIANSLIFSQLSVWFVTEMFSLLRQLTVLDETNVFADYQGNTQWPDIVAYAKTPAGFDDNGNIQYQAPSFSVNVCTDKNIFVNEYFSLLFFTFWQCSQESCGFNVASGLAEGAGSAA